MKKFRVLLLSITITVASSAAFYDRFDPPCADRPQYYKVGNFFFPAGEYGADYVCESGGGVCTYYLANPFNPWSYTPCRTGSYLPL